MEFSKTSNPVIKVYSRGGSSPSARIVARMSSDEEEEDRGRRESEATIRIEGDLNWASKYLLSDRSSSIPKGQNRGGGTATSTEDLKARSPTPGSSNGRHLDRSTALAGRNRRSISPMQKFREDREDLNGRSLRTSRASASPLTQRKDFGSRNGYLTASSGLPPIRSTSPKISQPITRTYDDLDRARVTSGNQRTKFPISGTRKKLRGVISRTRNDPHYFDDD